MMRKQILVDAREFVFGKKTGIGRFLEGLIDALCKTDFGIEINLACYAENFVPLDLRNRPKINLEIIPSSFLASEIALSKRTRRAVSLFISPYPKLPLFGTYCKSVNIVHDVFYLTHPAYKNGLKFYFDFLRVKKALNNADLTWYVSKFSQEQTRKLLSTTGRNPRVRYPGIQQSFSQRADPAEARILKTCKLNCGYILVAGNGLPHKNLGVLLQISDKIKRQLVFVGVRPSTQECWKSLYPKSSAVWLDHIRDEDLPCVMRNSFCLAQPSLVEGYGYPPLEAMSCGVPAVVSNIPALIEATGGFAQTADPELPHTWLAAFHKLENKDFYNHQVQRGSDWVKSLHGPKAWQSHLCDIQELIDKA